MEQETNTRCRMKISTTAKGTVQYELSCEYDTPEQTSENLSKSIDLIKEVIKSKGLKEAGAE